MQRPKI